MPDRPTPPQFSVVIATFNRASLVKRSIDSVLHGDFSDFEVIVVDDGSTDGTDAVLAGIDDDRLRVIHQENKGRTAARNRGAAMASGRYIVFLDSDDYADPRWLAALHALFADSEKHGAVSCGANQVRLSESGQIVQQSTSVPKPKGPVYDDHVASFITGTLAMQRALFEEIGGYDESLSHAENTELAHRLVAALSESGLTFAATSEPLITYEQCRSRLTRSDHLARLHAATTIIDRHGERYRQLGGRTRRSNYYAIAGANSAHLGDLGAARKYFVKAIKDAPTRPRGYGRLLSSLLRSVAHRVWKMPAEPEDDFETDDTAR